MSYDLTSLQILENGLNQSLLWGAPPDMVMRLRGAIAYESQSGLPRSKPQDIIETAPTDAAPVEVE